MPVPLEIHFHQLDRSPAVEADIRERMIKLEKFADDILSCRVTVEGPHKHHRRGNLFAVRVDLRVAGNDIVATRAADDDHSHEDVFVAVRDAFDAVRRQLQDRASLRRGNAKANRAAIPQADAD